MTSSTKTAVAITALLALAPPCRAWMDTILVVSNRSPYEVSVNFNGESACFNTQFDSSCARQYYAHYATNSETFLNSFKLQNNISDLRASLGSFSGQATIGAMDETNREGEWISFWAETVASGGCLDRDSYQGFDVVVNGKTTSFLLKDPAGSDWFMETWQGSRDGSARETIGSTGYFKPFGHADGMVNKLNNIFDPNIPLDYNFIYAGMPVDGRSACVMGYDNGGGYNCLVVGVGLMVMDENVIVMTPMPNLLEDWGDHDSCTHG